MNLYCTCTNTEPDFVGGLLHAYDLNLDNLLCTAVWLCHDCFEHHVCEQYNIRTVPDRNCSVSIELYPDGVTE